MLEDAVTAKDVFKSEIGQKIDEKVAMTCNSKVGFCFSSYTGLPKKVNIFGKSSEFDYIIHHDNFFMQLFVKDQIRCIHIAKSYSSNYMTDFSEKIYAFKCDSLLRNYCYFI